MRITNTLFLLLFPLFIIAQNADYNITGPAEVCGEPCGNYGLYYANGALVTDEVTWNFYFDYPVGTAATGNPLTLCVPPDAYAAAQWVVTATLAGSSAPVAEFTTEYTSDALPLTSNLVCQEENAPCLTMCAGQTSQFTVPSATVEYFWNIEGSDTYIVDENTAAVTWHTVGAGNISVERGGSNNLLVVNCGEVAPVGNPYTTGNAGGRYVFFEGGVGPYTVEIIGNNFYESTVEDPDGPGQLIDFGMPDGAEGIYNVTVTDSEGQTAECDFELTGAGCSEQYFNFGPISPTDCENCNGEIRLSQLQPGWSFLWNDGYTEADREDLCAGDYSVTITDMEGCERVRDFTLTTYFCEESCPAYAQQCIEIVPNPIAKFISFPAAENMTVDVCSGQSVYFQNQSSGADTFIWRFGDLETSVEANPEHVYAAPGSYEVTCIARNDCFCMDTTSLIVNVLPAAIPEIECTGTVCVGDTVTYRTPTECGQYQWTFSEEGDLIEGGSGDDNFIRIAWNAGPFGTIGLSVAGCNSGAICEQENLVQIPILSGDAEIAGPEKVCNNSQEIYSIPYYRGATYEWSVSEFGTITSGQNTHQITVYWEGESPNFAQSVSVTYDNCWMGCGGYAELPVSLVPDFYLLGPPVICEGETHEFFGETAGGTVPANLFWQLQNGSDSIVFISQNAQPAAEIAFIDGGGTYTLTAFPDNPDNWCSDSYSRSIIVNPAPPAPLGINGEQVVCLGQSYFYSAQSNLNNPAFKWLIDNNGEVTEFIGNTAAVTWTGAGPHTISVAQLESGGLNCESDYISQNIDILQNLTVEGPDEVCVESVSTYYTVDLPNITYQWSLTPSNAGFITAGQGENSIQIFWTTENNAEISVHICDESVTKNIAVNPLPDPVVDYLPEVCPGEVSPVGSPEAFAAYTWKNASGTPLGNTQTAELPAGYYALEVENDAGCRSNVAFQIDHFPPPPLNLTSPDPTTICSENGSDFPVLYASNIPNAVMYQWFLNGELTSGSGQIYGSESFGDYQVAVEDTNGCTYWSNVLSVVDDCDAQATECDETLEFAANFTDDCNTIDFIPLSENIVSIASWDFGDGTVSEGENVTHTYAEAGYYLVTLFAYVEINGNTVLCYGQNAVSFPAVADFEIQPECAGTPTRFFDESQLIDSENIETWAWDFGDPASPQNTADLPDPTHEFSGGGTFTVTLTVTGSAGCTSTATQDITILPSPSVDFAPIDPSCEAKAVFFTAETSANTLFTEWNFGDPGSGTADTATTPQVWHNFAAAGSYNVTLIGSNVYNCADTMTRTVTLTENEMDGLITSEPGLAVCDGGTVTMIAPPFPEATYAWSNGVTEQAVIADAAGSFRVTVTDGNGCTYVPPTVTTEFFAQPLGDVYAVQYDDFGNPINYIFEEYFLCVGEDLHLEVTDNETFIYQWSTGESGPTVQYGELRDNKLEEGEHDISVTVTDPATGCISVAVFNVTVHPQPVTPVIISDTATPICPSDEAVLSISNPFPTYNYEWNSGEDDNEITLYAGGEYWVEATNEFGCTTSSNHIFAENSPDMGKIPDGCHTRCGSDTLCLPGFENVVGYQWYLDGEAMAAPLGTTPDLITEESGDYTLEMTDAAGCVFTSEPLSLYFYQGTGSITGAVYTDSNENGIIDAEDEILPDIDILLLDATGQPLTQAASDAAGIYGFNDIASTEYLLELDTTNLPGNVTYNIIENAAQLTGCEDVETVNWLLSPYCAPVFADLAIPSCDGDAAIFQDTEIAVGAAAEFVFASFFGCDSTLTVTVFDATSPPGAETVTICNDSQIEINGSLLSVGESVDIFYENQYGCDSLVTVTVLGTEEITGTDNVTVCAGETTEVNGETLAIGESTDVVFTAQNGCDSIVTVTVLGLDAITGTDTYSVCEDTTATLNGQTLAIGESTDMIYTAQNGCDSIVTVTITGMQTQYAAETFGICGDENVEYHGYQLAAETETEVTLTAQNGCDSVVTVTVTSLDSPLTFAEYELCPGETVGVQGQTLQAGETAEVLYTNAAGCDSLVQITAVSLASEAVTAEAEICPGEVYVYENTELQVGDSQSFTLTNQAGCDSTVLLSVTAYPPAEFYAVPDYACAGFDDGSFTIPAPQGGAPPFTYSTDGENWQTAPTFTGLPGGAHLVHLRDAHGCLTTEEVFIPTAPPLTVEDSEQVLPCAADEIRLFPVLFGGSGDLDAAWSNGDSTLTPTVTETGVYDFTVSDICYSESASVTVVRARDFRNNIFYIPNAFSPNDDGINDYLCTPTGNDVQVLSYNFMVFDRWGNQVYRSDKQDDCWDGRHFGQEMNTAVFAYVLEARVLICEEVREVFLYGDVSLVG